MPGRSTALVAAAAEGAASARTACPRRARTDRGRRVDRPRRPRGRGARKAVKRAAALGDAVAYTRDLVNQPPNLLYPETFVASLESRVKATKVKLKTYDLKQLRSGGFGGTVGVGQGSANEPRIAVLTYSPARPKATIALVGKGITFDSGGLCIKPAAAC